ncbi:MAG: GNAT family N-acetyltransferase [Victivallales bacterium]|nr:GNAT family N-acetyltransferase [Victivallales bacterium]
MIKLITQRLIVREYHSKDILLHHKLISDPEVMYYMQEVFSHSYDESVENLEFAIKESEKADRTSIFLVIANKKTKEYMGGIGYEVISKCPLGKQVEIGFFLYPKYQGQGYAKEAFLALQNYAFTKGDVYRINGTCISENKNSKFLMLSSGMIKEAYLKGVQWHFGKLKSRYLFRLLKNEWEKL